VRCRSAGNALPDPEPPDYANAAYRQKPSNAMQDVPLAVLTATICTYWICVGVMIVRVRRKTHRDVGVVPEQGLERLMWIVWVPLVMLWIYVPWATLAGHRTVPALPGFATGVPAYRTLRWLAAVAAVVSLGATINCWMRMGKDWRMDVDLHQKAALITDGLFAYIRHPIYAFSILLMFCSAIIVPTAPMIAIAVIHVALMNVKARNEERHLLTVHGDAYARYLRASGRFIPRRRTHET
jgi:protein-S-isoprenylcysteine O-methyltransferase Ste14